MARGNWLGRAIAHLTLVVTCEGVVDVHLSEFSVKIVQLFLALLLSMEPPEDEETDKHDHNKRDSDTKSDLYSFVRFHSYNGERKLKKSYV